MSSLIWFYLVWYYKFSSKWCLRNSIKNKLNNFFRHLLYQQLLTISEVGYFYFRSSMILISEFFHILDTWTHRVCGYTWWSGPEERGFQKFKRDNSQSEFRNMITMYDKWPINYYVIAIFLTTVRKMKQWKLRMAVANSLKKQNVPRITIKFQLNKRNFLKNRDYF